MPQHVPPLEEIEKQFLTEFNYLGEAANLREIADNVMPTWGDKARLLAPAVSFLQREKGILQFLPMTIYGCG